MPPLLNHLHTLGYIVGIFRHIELEDFKDIDFRRAVSKTGITEHRTERLALGNFLDHAFRDVFIKAGNQVWTVQPSISSLW